MVPVPTSRNAASRWACGGTGDAASEPAPLVGDRASRWKSAAGGAHHDQGEFRRKQASVDIEFGEISLRLMAAAAAGGLIGLNRDLADKPIGVRTLSLVALGAATVSIAGVQVQGMAENADALSRVVQGVIQGIMAGISFVGAGVILRNAESRTVEGLTTAATVWMSAAVGIACGLGAWRTIAVALPITLVVLFSSGWTDWFKKRNRADGKGDGL